MVQERECVQPAEGEEAARLRIKESMQMLQPDRVWEGAALVWDADHAEGEWAEVEGEINLLLFIFPNHMSAQGSPSHVD